MRKFFIIVLGICIIGTGCSGKSAEKSTEQFSGVGENETMADGEDIQALELETELETVIESLPENDMTSAPEIVNDTSDKSERIQQLLNQSEEDAEKDRAYILEAVENEEAYKRDAASMLFIKEQYPDYFSSIELLEKSIVYGHYQESIYLESAGQNNARGKYYQSGKIVSDIAQEIYLGTSKLSDDSVQERLEQMEEILQFFYGESYGKQ